MNITIERAIPKDSPTVAVMVGELLNEIMNAIGVQTFHFNIEEAIVHANDFLENEKYFAFIARGAKPVGFVALYESHALYAEGAFGTIPEFYVRPEFRCKGIGRLLIQAAKEFGGARGWKRFEVTTPPLPQFERTLRFYERQGFSVTGGQKLKTVLQ